MSLTLSQKLSMIRKSKALKACGFILPILYPFCVFWALHKGMSLRWLSLFLLIIVLSAFLRSHRKTFLAAGLFLTSALLLFNNEIFLKLYPVCMNMLICFSFWISLKTKPLITVFAEKMGQEMTPDVLHYTRKVTIAWGIFMALSTLISIITLSTPMWIWTLYNGLISYLLIGLMFGGEYLIRRRCQHESL